MVGGGVGGTNKSLPVNSKSVGGRSSPTIPRILSPKKVPGQLTCNPPTSVTSNQTTKDIARSLFKETVQKSEGCPSIKTCETTSTNSNIVGEKNDIPDTETSISSKLSVPTIETHRSIILAADAIVTPSDVDDHSNTASGFQSSPSNVMNFSIVNGKLQNATSTNRVAEESNGMNTFKPIIPEDGEEKDNNAVDNETEELKSEKICTFPELLGENSNTLVDLDLFKPLDGKNIDEIDEESSSVFSDSCLKLTRNELGLLEVSGDANCVKEKGIETSLLLLESQMDLPSSNKLTSSSLPSSDSDDSDSIDLTCKEDAPSSPSPKKDSEGNEQKNVHQNMKGKIKHNTTNKISARLLSVTKANDTTSTTTLNPKVKEDDEILCCGGCGCYGMSGEFLNSEACSSSCQERIVQRIREKEKKERELLIQKQRREARKKEREAREAAEEADKRRLAESEASEAAKRVEEAQKISMKASHDIKEEIIMDDDDDESDIKLLKNVSTSSQSILHNLSIKSDSNDRSENAKAKVKLADGNVDKASVIIEGISSQSSLDKLSSSNKDVSRGLLQVKNDEDLSNKISASRTLMTLPWQDPNTKTGFSWTKYLEATRSKIAPSKIFDETARFPHSTNRFKVGMKLEAIDPEHPALFCVVTVVCIKGYRIRLHFDGYSDSYDFWENANSRNIFPPGWCKQHQQRLEPPKGWNGNAPNRYLDPILSFTWQKYMADESSCKIMVKGRRQALAPKQIFTEPPKLPQNWLAGWNVGMKLEAVDKQNASLVCVATVGNILTSDGRILIHFDGWEIEYDYWVKPDSPYIRPKGWCDQSGVTLNKPKGYRGDFKWDHYLEETSCRAVPAWAFRSPKSSNISLFRKGMKLEAVDKRNPVLIRVATISEVICHQLRIHYDGWPEEYDIWLEDISTDIHPATWCAKTGHPLTLPLTPQEVKLSESLQNASAIICPTPGCHGVGNNKGPRYLTHNSLEACPYSPRNIGSESLIPDRLQGSFKQHEGQVDKASVHENSSTYPTRYEKSTFNLQREDKLERITRRKRKRNAALANEKGHTRENEANHDNKFKRLDLSANSMKSSHEGDTKNLNLKGGGQDQNLSSSSLLLRDNVFRPPYEYTNNEDKECGIYSGHQRSFSPPLAWEKNVDFLRSRTYKLSPKFVSKWSSHRVAYFVSSLPGICRNLNTIVNGNLKEQVLDCEESDDLEMDLNGSDENELGDIPSRFLEEEIDGEAFLMLTQADLVKTLGLKLGPALKILNTLVMIRSNCQE